MGDCCPAVSVAALPFVVVVEPRQAPVVVVAAGRQGPAGRPGTNGGETFQFEQEDPLAVWTVPHNLQRRPSVMVTDLAGNAVISDIRYIDDNIIQITHGRPVSGFAYCN
ncbi:hypothetical protein [Pseudomonas sp. NPDC079086]|uniref:hypothetical protein n=1 Tax=unclassified Pseudomonas TaxID=196821 RepID=UPI0037CA1068